MSTDAMFWMAVTWAVRFASAAVLLGAAAALARALLRHDREDVPPVTRLDDARVQEIRTRMQAAARLGAGIVGPDGGRLSVTGALGAHVRVRPIRRPTKGRTP